MHSIRLKLTSQVSTSHAVTPRGEPLADAQREAWRPNYTHSVLSRIPSTSAPSVWHDLSTFPAHRLPCLEWPNPGDVSRACCVPRTLFTFYTYLHLTLHRLSNFSCIGPKNIRAATPASAFGVRFSTPPTTSNILAIYYIAKTGSRRHGRVCEGPACSSGSACWRPLIKCCTISSLLKCYSESQIAH